MELNNFLSKFGITHDQLSSEERKTLAKWLDGSSKGKTVEDIKEHVREMSDVIARELCSEDLPKKKDIFLKARLRNYLALYDFIANPEKAKKALEDQLRNIKGRL